MTDSLGAGTGSGSAEGTGSLVGSGVGVSGVGVSGLGDSVALGATVTSRLGLSLGLSPTDGVLVGVELVGAGLSAGSAAKALWGPVRTCPASKARGATVTARAVPAT